MVQTVTDNHTAVSDVIAWELEGNHRPSRKNVTIAASQSLVNGQVIAFDGTGNVIKFSVQATNAAAGIFIGDAVTTGAGQTAKGVIIDSMRVMPKVNWHMHQALPTARKPTQ